MVPVDRYAVTRLYCACNKIPLGLDVLAHAVRTACCAQLVIDSLVVWMGRAFGNSSPALRLADFRTALERLQEEGDDHPGEGVEAELGLELLDRVSTAVVDHRHINRSVFAVMPRQNALTCTFHVLDTSFHDMDMLDSGSTHEALALLGATLIECRADSSAVLR